MSTTTTQYRILVGGELADATSGEGRVTRYV